MSIFHPRAARFTAPEPEPVDEPTVDLAELEPLSGHERLALLRLIHRTLWSESLREPEMRDGAAVDLALDVRLILAPPPAAAGPVAVGPVGIRPSVPVVPGRPS